MKDETRKVIALTNVRTQIEAELLQDLLQQEGIAVMIKEHGSGGYSKIYMGISLFGETLYVNDYDYPRAVELIQAMEQSGALALETAQPDAFDDADAFDAYEVAQIEAAEQMKNEGAEIVDISMPSIDNALAAYYIISSAEASSNLSRFDGVRYGYRTDCFENIHDLYKKSRSEGFGKEVKRRIMLGTFALSSGYYDAYYKKALQIRSIVMNDFENSFKKCDFILSPVAPTVAYKLGEKSKNPLEMYMGDAYSVPVNIAGVPAISVPCGRGEGNMPVGAQLIGPAFSEKMLYRAAAVLEEVSK